MSIIEDLKRLDIKHQELLDEIDKNAINYNRSNHTVLLAKISINSAVSIIKGKPSLKKKLKPKDIQKIIGAINEFGEGKRNHLFLILNEDKSGIYDPISKKHFFFE